MKTLDLKVIILFMILAFLFAWASGGYADNVFGVLTYVFGGIVVVLIILKLTIFRNQKR